ncbi:aminotransferase class V-fold PLP-dependent enzyme, partial [Mycolicibacterium poriferae]|uniref:aminotransferase class V-fold PLP-dependent enzyme n=1 Tax=Mycolicibacterium poriferae TaxID=39694 RepID=UPI0024B9196C
MKVSHSFAAASAVFDDEHLVSCAGLVPVMALATQTGLSDLIAGKVRITEPRITSGAANPAPKLTTVVAGMCAGADSIEDLDIVRSGGMKSLFGGVYAPSTIGTLLREFTFGHARQLESVLREHLAGLCERVALLPGAEGRAFVDIDSLLRPVYGHAKQGASYGHTKIAGKQILRKGLSPLVTTISTAHSAPVIAGARLRAGKTNSGKGAARMIAQAVATARTAGGRKGGRLAGWHPVDLAASVLDSLVDRTGVDPALVAERLTADKDHAIKVVAVVHNETSTGVTSDIGNIRKAIDAAKHPALFMVDTISSLASIDYRHEEWGVDVTVGGSQKGLMLPPGLGFNAVSDKALGAAKTARLARSYWDWEPMVASNETGYFPFTPATNL